MDHREPDQPEAHQLAAPHLEASGRLTEFVGGSLSEAERRSVEQHLAGCEECAAWVAAYRDLAEGLSASTQTAARPRGAPGHLSSDELCRLALASDTLAQAARERGARHLETCGDCRAEIALVRVAAAEAREERTPWSSLAARLADSASLPRLAWAASLLLVVGVLMVSQAGPPVPAYRQLSSSTLDGRTMIHARDTIVVETTRIKSGAELSLRTGGSVAFGDGFSVDSGGSLSVVIDESHDL